MPSLHFKSIQPRILGAIELSLSCSEIIIQFEQNLCFIAHGPIGQATVRSFHEVINSIFSFGSRHRRDGMLNGNKWPFPSRRRASRHQTNVQVQANRVWTRLLSNRDWKIRGINPLLAHTRMRPHYAFELGDKRHVFAGLEPRCNSLRRQTNDASESILGSRFIGYRL